MSEQNSVNTGINAPKSLAWTMIVFAVIGWIGAFSLTLERLHVATNPDAVLPCDLNVFISCKSVMLTPTARLFGFPNSLIGLAAFVAPIAVGVGILAGAKFAMWFWRLFLTGITLGFVFVLFLFSQSLFVINVLCPYCMVAWAGMIPIFWHVFLFSAKEDIVPMPIRTTTFWDWAATRPWLITIVFELLIILAIVFRFWANWGPMFRKLGWF